MNRLKSLDKIFKKLIAVSILLFFIFLTILLLGKSNKENNQVGINPNPISSPNDNIQAQDQQGSITLTTEEVAKHNLTTDCWIIIDSKVYKVTDFLSQHPGGIDKIVPFCGQDATAAFHTRDGRGEDHSPFAQDLLKSFLVGGLGESVTN